MRLQWLTNLLRLLTLALLLASGSTLAKEFQVQSLQTSLVDGHYLAEASIQFEFSAQALEALQSGVPLTIEIHLQLRRKGAWIWVADLVDKRLRYKISYQALAGVYQVTDLQTEGIQRFATREAALIALGSVRDVEVIEQQQLESGKAYVLAMRCSLDIEALPLPLRPMAYLSPAWNLSSEWRVWLLKD